MTKLESKLRNVKKQSFKIVFEEGVDEVRFWYEKNGDAIVVSSVHHWSAGDWYKFSQIDEIISRYGEYEELIS